MTKNRSMRIAVLVLALALITCCFVGTTFAKYTSSAEGTAAVSIAKWQFTSANLDGTTVKDFDLFATVNGNGTDDETTDDLDVADGVIAPGTKGAFEFTIKNDSEVTAYIDLDVTMPTELSFITPTYAYTVDGSEATADANGVEVGYGETLVVTVAWEWGFEQNTDTVDNGLAGKTGLEATVAVSMTQKN